MAPSNHPQPRVLKALAAGTLDAADAAAVRAHLETCADCARLVDGGADEPIPPELLNTPDYTDIEELSRGGMGIIYTATSVMTRRQEVLKVMNRDMMRTPGAADRFLREIQSAALLDHPNIVRVLSARRFGDLMVLAMEYVPGEDLGSLVRSRGALPVVNACHYVRQAANGLQHAFEKGMVHRDIKPSNLIRTVSGKQHAVKILDFGLAKLTSETGSESGQTKTGQVLGTPDYIAPEQIRKAKSADIRADIYALGGTLYFLLTGRPPFQADNLYDLFRQHHEASPVPVHEVRPDVPRGLSDVIGHMMAKDPAARYQTPKEVATALEPFVKGGTSSGKARETVVDPTEDDKLAAIYAAKTIAPAPEKVGAARPSQKVATIFTQKTEYKAPEPSRSSRRSRDEDEPGRLGRGTWIALGVGGICLVGLILVLVVMNVKPRDDTKNSDTSSDTKPSRQAIPNGPGPKGPPLGGIALGALAAGEVRKFEIASGVFMEFCWVPPGEAQLGSPKDEQDYITKTFFEGKRPEYLDAEMESYRGKKTFSGFWLGKYTVTQAEWKAVMGNNPSYFQPGGQGKDRLGGIADTSRFPVEMVCWDDPAHPEFSCQKFLEKINRRDGIEKAFGKGASFKLPHEDQWEYACRGGRGNKQPFYFGNVLNGTQANCDGDYPYGTTTKGKNLNRTCAVDYTNDGEYAKHPWGLCHVAGNVYQWCENKYDDVGSGRVDRGGCWYDFAGGCRSADRSRHCAGGPVLLPGLPCRLSSVWSLAGQHASEAGGGDGTERSRSGVVAAVPSERRAAWAHANMGFLL